MAVPVFKIKEDIKKHNIIVLSSNYALYGDISERYSAILRGFTPYLEVYSIDESFLDLSGFLDIENYGHEIKQSVYQNIGLPVCVGIGRTKTLAKLANRIAKKNKQFEGVYVLPDNNDNLLKTIKTSDLWGIARATSEKLRGLGICTAYDLKKSEPKMIRNHLSVVIEKTVLELNNIQCLDLELVQENKKAVIVSRSFGKKIRNYKELRQAISSYTTRAAEKIRQQGLVAHKLSVFVMNSPFNKAEESYYNSFSVTFPESTNDSSLLIKTACYCLKKIFKSNVTYFKAGVLLDGLEIASITQTDMFFKPRYDQNKQLMECLDLLNKRHGRNTVFYGSSGIDQSWKMSQKSKSQNYTTSWDELPIAG
jgi:DNA polymerase V